MEVEEYEVSKMCEDVRRELMELGYKIVYKPHKIMKDYNATYNVIY